ncbi:hypothetical protein T08_3322, partial [Trichinella sp. T8]
LAHTRLYHNGINDRLPSMPLWRVSWCQQSTVDVRGCYFHFCQAVHRKVGELGLKTRYRTEEGTRRKIRMLLATAYLYLFFIPLY